LSLCYDLEKWTILSLALVAISLSIGLFSIAYGQGNNTSIKINNMSIEEFKTSILEKLFQDKANENVNEIQEKGKNQTQELTEQENQSLARFGHQLSLTLSKLDCLIRNTANFPEMQKYNNLTVLNETVKRDIIALTNQPDFLIKANQTAEYCVKNSEKYYDEFKQRLNISGLK